MSPAQDSAASRQSADRTPPNSREAEEGVLGSILLDADRVLDLCVVRQIVADSFYIPAHRFVYEAMLDLSKQGKSIDVLTVCERLQTAGHLEKIGGSSGLNRLVDSTPTAAHAEFYIDIVRQKHLLRCIIAAARQAEADCYATEDSADVLLGRVEQSFLDITEHQHGSMTGWDAAVHDAMTHVERIFETRRGLSGISSGFVNVDGKLHGLRPGEMIVLAARPSMGKTSLAMNMAENVALGHNDPDRLARAVGIFSLEMSCESLVFRMLCSHGKVSGFKLLSGYVSATADHQKLIRAASALRKAKIYLDDTGGLDVLELRARARRMKMKYGIELIVVDYLQLLHSREYAKQGKQVETSAISGELKSMAKELKLPVLVLSQLSRAPEQRDKLAVPKLSDLRDSGAIEQDADVVAMLRRPCKYPGDPDHGDATLSILDIVKHRNGPTGEVRLNFDEEFTRFSDRVEHRGVDPVAENAAVGHDVEDSI